MKILRSYSLRLLSLLVLLSMFSVVQGQVLVHEEPRHHPVFQNADIRLLNVLMPPGDTSQYHIHHTPSVFIFFTKTKIGSQSQGKAAVLSETSAGRILFENLASPNIRIHRVWNVDQDTFHVIDLELLFKDSGFVKKTLTSPYLKLEIDTAWVRAYRLSLSNGQSFRLSNKMQSFVLVSLNTSEVQTLDAGKSKRQTVKAGSFFDIKGGYSFSIKNNGKNTGEFCLLELPTQ